MSPSEPELTGVSASFLSEQWRAASHASVWRTPGDWHGPAVESMARAVVDGADPEAAAAGLGADRGQRGVGLAEGLEDLSALFGLASAEEPPYAVTAAFAREWAEVATGALLARGSTDSLTGLATLDYLAQRLREIYREAAASEAAVDDSRCIVVVDAGTAGLQRWQHVMRSSVIARILTSVFDRGQTNAVLPSGTFVTVALRDDCLDEWLVRLRAELRRDGLLEPPEGNAVTIRVESFPETAFEAEELFAQL